MNDIDTAKRWWKSLNVRVRSMKIIDVWERAGRPMTETKPVSPSPDPRLDLGEVEDLRYRIEREIATSADFTRFSKLFRSPFGELPEFTDAMLRGRARAIAELPRKGTYEQVLARLRHEHGLSPTEGDEHV